MKKIKLLLLADANSPHTIKWARYLANSDTFDVHIFSLTKVENTIFFKNEGISFHNSIRFSINKNKSGISKLKYILTLPKLLKTIRKIKPDILHSHYATSYGLLGSLSFFHPFIISVWGSDVYDFPKKSFFHRFVLKYNLKHADRILSTSVNMAQEIKKLSTEKIDITPFGVDIDLFKPITVGSLFEENTIVIGTIKSLEPVYGIDYLIKSFSIICDKFQLLNLRLLIVGEGSLKQELINLCINLKIKDKVIFTGYIKNEELVKYYNMLDIYVALSNSESFGVAVLEASSCGIPVVVSDVGGLPEVVEKGKTGFIVPSQDVNAAVQAIEKLVNNYALRKEMGINARNFVETHYSWKNNAKIMIEIYKSILRNN